MSCVLDLSSPLSLLDCVPRRCSSQVADLYVAAVRGAHFAHHLVISQHFKVLVGQSDESCC